MKPCAEEHGNTVFDCEHCVAWSMAGVRSIESRRAWVAQEIERNPDRGKRIHALLVKYFEQRKPEMKRKREKEKADYLKSKTQQKR